VLVVIDRPRAETPPPPQPIPASARLRVAPVFGATNGMSLSYTF